MDKNNLSIYTIGIFFISLAVSIIFYASGIDLMIDIPLILVIMGAWGIYVGLQYYSERKEKYYLGWSIIVMAIGILWIMNTCIPGYSLYLLALLFLIVGGLIIFMPRA